MKNDVKNDVRPVPEWLLERLHRDDLPPAEAARLRARIATDPGAAARLGALAASDQEILAALPPAVVAREVQRRLTQRPARSRTLAFAFSGLTFAVAAAGVALFALRPPAVTQVQDDGPEITNIKGLRPQLAVYRKLGERADRLAAGALVRPGDTLQLAYVAAGRRYGVVVSVDARGTVTPHLPEAPGASVVLAGPGETALPHAFSLDDSPGFERFVLVAADQPFSTAQVVESLRPGGPRLPRDFVSVELTLRKEIP